MERRKNYFGGRYYLPHRKFEKLATSLLVIPFIQDQNVIIKKRIPESLTKYIEYQNKPRNSTLSSSSDFLYSYLLPILHRAQRRKTLKNTYIKNLQHAEKKTKNKKK